MVLLKTVPPTLLAKADTARDGLTRGAWVPCLVLRRLLML
jgi:hypothetical protein